MYVENATSRTKLAHENQRFFSATNENALDKHDDRLSSPLLLSTVFFLSRVHTSVPRASNSFVIHTRLNKIISNQRDR